MKLFWWKQESDGSEKACFEEFEGLLFRCRNFEIIKDFSFCVNVKCLYSQEKKPAVWNKIKNIFRKKRK